MLLFDIWSKAQFVLEMGLFALNYYTDQDNEDRSDVFIYLHYFAAVMTLTTQKQIVDYGNQYREYWSLKT